MLKLHHFTLCPFSRQVRIILREKQLEFSLSNECYWQKSQNLLKLNPSGQLPILIDDDEVISEFYPICEYLEEKYLEIRFLSHNPTVNAEIRRIVNWFNTKFYNEVTKYILHEKVIKHYMNSESPRPEYIRAGRVNILAHLEYIEFLLKKRKWLACDKISLADFGAAAHLSVLDYLGDVPWDYRDSVKEWYSIIKSRPSFRSLLNDRISGFNPSDNYENLDF